MQICNSFLFVQEVTGSGDDQSATTDTYVDDGDDMMDDNQVYEQAGDDSASDTNVQAENMLIVEHELGNRSVPVSHACHALVEHHENHSAA